MKPINQSKLTDEGKHDKWRRYKTVKKFSGMGSERCRERETDTRPQRENKKTWRELEEESTAMNSETGREGRQIAR